MCLLSMDHKATSPYPYLPLNTGNHFTHLTYFATKLLALFFVSKNAGKTGPTVLLPEIYTVCFINLLFSYSIKVKLIKGRTMTNEMSFLAPVSLSSHFTIFSFIFLVFYVSYRQHSMTSTKRAWNAPEYPLIETEK